MSLWRRVYAERRTVVLPVLVFLVANVAAFALGVVPLRQNVGSSEDAAKNASMKLAAARLLDYNAKDAKAKKEQADQELKKFYEEILPKGYNAANTVANFRLQGLARQSGLQVKSLQFDPESIKDSRLGRVKGRVTLTGDYTNIRRFLYALETAQEFVIVNRVELSQVSAQSGSGTLEVVLDVATYYLAGEQGAGAGQ
jgi:Tfp pilus assembly protein PilO